MKQSNQKASVKRICETEIKHQRLISSQLTVHCDLRIMRVMGKENLAATHLNNFQTNIYKNTNLCGELLPAGPS